jgi:hypothetical protein
MVNAIENFTFHNASTATGNGNVFTNRGASTMVLQFLASEGCTFSCIVESQLIDATAWYAHPCFKYPSYTDAPAITDKTYLYEIPIPAATKVRVRITAIAGGNLIVLGRAVA